MVWNDLKQVSAKKFFLLKTGIYCENSMQFFVHESLATTIIEEACLQYFLVINASELLKKPGRNAFFVLAVYLTTIS